MTNHEVFEKILTDQHIPNAIEHYKSAAYVNGLVSVAQGLQRTDGMQEQRLLMQARQAVNMYIASNRNVDKLHTLVLCQRQIWEAAAEFMKAVREHPQLSFADHALFPLWVLLLGDGLSLRVHHKTMKATHVIEAHEKFIDSFVEKYVFDQQLGVNTWGTTGYNNAVDFWSVYLSHLLTTCSVRGYIERTFEGQYYAGLLPDQIRLPATDMSCNGAELQRSQLPDASQRTHKGKAVAPAHIAATGDGHGGFANDGSDSDDACGWPADWKMVERPKARRMQA